MSSLIIPLTIRVSGSLADADTTPTIAVVRVDTGASVSSGLMTKISTGYYNYTVSSPISGVTYRWTITATVSGNLTTVVDEHAFLGTVSGNYTNDTKIAEITGRANLVAYSDVESSGSQNDTAIQRAIDTAEAEVSAYLAVNGLEDDYTNPKLIDAASLLAAYKLYRARSVRNESADGNYQDISKAWKRDAHDLMMGYALKGRTNDITLNVGKVEL